LINAESKCDEIPKIVRLFTIKQRVIINKLFGMVMESRISREHDNNIVTGVFHGGELLISRDDMFYSVDFDRVFHDVV
jgi:hypothetical protein